MPDQLTSLPQLPPDAPPSWLAANRRSVILGAVVLLLVGAVIGTSLLQRRPNPTTNNAATNTGTTDTTNRPGFQRSFAENKPTGSIPTYPLPTQQDLQNAITNQTTNR